LRQQNSAQVINDFLLQHTFSFVPDMFCY